MKVLGLRLLAGIPFMEMLCTYHANPNQENHINIAYRYFEVKPGKYQAILLVWENTMSIYTVSDFQRTFHR